ncbi:DNA internalization-related competence protein ComEC/Rec2 [soil metagenome]
MSALARPLVVAVLVLVAGMLAGLRFGSTTSYWAAAALLTSLFALAVARKPAPPGSRHPGEAALWLSLICTGVALGASARSHALADCRVHIPDGAPVTMHAVLAANGIALADTLRGDTPLLPVRAVEVRVHDAPVPGCMGEMRVRLPGTAASLLAGTEVALIGEWRRSTAPVVSSPWPRRPRFAGALRVDSFTVVAQPRVSAHPLLTLRGRAERHLHQLFPRHGALADALLLGRRESLDPALQDRFARSGLIHLLAISGTHVALLIGALYFFGKALGLRQRALVWGTIAALLFYLGLIGAPPSAVRAGIMIALALVGLLLQRPSARLPIIAAAAGFLAVLDPLVLLDPGFQLSFSGVLGIFAIRGASLEQLPTQWRSGPAKYLVEAAVVSFAAFVATAPVAAHHFGRVAPIAILANLPAIPAMSVALMGIAAAALVEPIIPPLGRLLAAGAGGMLDLLGWIAALAMRVPYGHAEVARPQWPLWVAAGVVLLLALEVTRRLQPRVRALAAAGTAGAFVLMWPLLAAPGSAALELHFLDVGQGDAIAIRTPANRWVLVDAGPRSDQYDAGDRRVLPFLRAHGVRRLEAMVLTHPHADHIGGAAAVLRAMPVGRLIEPGLAVGSPIYLETLRAAEEREVPYALARSGRTITIDGVVLQLLWPEGELLDGVEDANEISAVLQLRFGNFAALLTGDVSEAVERALVAEHGDRLRSQLLKAGHHGSRTSTSAVVLDATQPELVVISAGRRNFYGHPAPEVMDRLARRGIQVARTDREGTVSVRTDGQRWSRIVP